MLTIAILYIGLFDDEYRAHGCHIVEVKIGPPNACRGGLGTEVNSQY